MRIAGAVFRHLRRAAAAYAVLLISLSLTGLAWYYVQESVDAQARNRFDEIRQGASIAIERRTEAYVDLMYGTRGLFYASETVDLGEWLRYVSSIRPQSNYEGVQALGYAERVEPAEREAFLRDSGLPEVRPDLSPGGERPVYFPITYEGPLDEANESRLGYDLYSDAVHRVAMDRARDTGEPQATDRTYVLMKAGEGSPADLALRPGFAMYLPVYSEGTPETVAQRRQDLQGFVFVTVGRSGLLEGVFSGAFDPRLDFEVYIGDGFEEDRLLYDDDGVKRGGNDRYESMFSEQESIEVANSELLLYFSTLPGFQRGLGGSLPGFVLASGIATSLLLFGVTWMLIRSRTRAERASFYLEDANQKLEGTNRELEAFSYSVSHDLRAPLRTIDGFSRILLEDYAEDLDEEARDYLGRVRAASVHMGRLIDDLLNLSRVTRSPLHRERVDLSALVAGIARELQDPRSEREVEFVIEEGVTAWGDARLLLVALENLLGNAWKFTGKTPGARIEFGVEHRPGGAYYVRDNGAGFDMDYADKLFGAFQRLHGAKEFEGTGIGLATVQRIVHRHGGRVWAEGEVGRGAAFYFTLGGVPAESGVEREKVELA